MSGNAETTCRSCERVSAWISVPVILAVLYIPQLWFFFMKYPYNEQWLSWLWIFPGLPTFFPMGVILSHARSAVSEPLAICLMWLGTFFLVGALMLSGRKPGLFWCALALALCLSVVSAFGAYGAFRF